MDASFCLSPHRRGYCDDVSEVKRVSIDRMYRRHKMAVQLVDIAALLNKKKKNGSPRNLDVVQVLISCAFAVRGQRFSM
jgi:hypothetical protein